MRNSICYALDWYSRKEEPSSGLRAAEFCILNEGCISMRERKITGWLRITASCVPLTHIESYEDYLYRSVYT